MTMTFFLSKLLCVLVLTINFKVITNTEPAGHSLIVKTTYGYVKGMILRTIQKPHSEFYSFRGIPYAKPPLDTLRFKPPINPDPWPEVKLCRNYGSLCLQLTNPINGSVVGNENCLTLNVFARDLNQSNLKPVMVWIHGGAHAEGSSSECGPDYLMDKSVVLVSMNYRLNIFGFLSVNDENAYGNIAIKDQIAALEWIRDNIINFGGDPGKVTIFGGSSGADSVSLLQLSKRTKGLFHQIILHSGSALNSRYLQRDPLKYAYNVAKYFNISTNTTRNIVRGLQNIDAHELVKAAYSPDATGYHLNLHARPFFPIIEVENSDAIITRSPYELFESGTFNKVPYMIGYTTNEGTLGFGIVNLAMNIEDFDKNVKLFAPHSLNNPENENTTGTIVKRYCLGNASTSDSNKFSKFLGQELLARGIRKEIDFQRKHSSGFFYRFAYKGTHTTELEGVGHAEEWQYVFPIQGQTENITEDDILTRKRMVEMWANFATFGSPIPNDTLLSQSVSWPRCNKTTLSFLDIGKELTPGTNPDEEDYIFANDLFDTYGVKPYETF